ncbi:MAG TPA: flagellar biosynthesis protein FlhA [Phycisphaerae bacterium]
MAKARPTQLFALIGKYRGMVLPIFALALIIVILVPLPTGMMDVLLSGNITLSAVVLLTVMYMRSPLEFSSFPSLLLSLTLLRLVLNIATTRLILTNAAAGADAAGHVVRVFGAFVASGNLMVGMVIFAIIVVIQFVVITKGATRIAEVAARFTLDGMPGKQMAIDADLNAGSITDAEAKRRREEVSREADFYGAMDGASKFVRGDAIAGIIITIVNILGGMYVGLVEQGMTFMDTLRVFTVLTIGDGLVSQIPAFIVSIAAAMIVTRSASKADFGEELLGQLTSRPVALGLAAGFLGLLVLTPLPKAPMALLAGSCALAAWVVRRSQASVALASAAAARDRAAPAADRIEKLLAIDQMELEVGYGLIRLVDRKQGGDLLDRITNIRKQVAQELGIVVPPIRIRDNIQLQPNQYRLKLKGFQIGEGELLPGHLLAINAGTAGEPLHGIATKEPAFGLPAQWILETQRQDAQHRNYTVVEPTSVLATHLTELIRRHADELLTRQEVNRLIDALKERAPKVVEELIPTVIKPGEVHRVLQALLREGVPIRDLETIVETLGDWAPRTKDIDILNEYVRNALARTLCQGYRGEGGKINCLTFDPAVEDLIQANIERNDRGAFLALPPRRQQALVDAVRDQIERALPACGGKTPVLLCPPQIRLWVRRMIEPVLPHVPVLSFNEIVRGVPIESRGMVALPNTEGFGSPEVKGDQ